MTTAWITTPTPYVTPDILQAAPVGISWATLPTRDATPDVRLAAVYNLCTQASAMVDEYIDQVLRATVNVEPVRSGDFRWGRRGDGTARLLLSSGPIVSVLGGRYGSTSAFPRTWTSLDSTDFEVEKPPLGLYSASASGSGEGGLAVYLRPGIGQANTLVEVTYISGWPHCGLAADADAGESTLAVDELAGWMSGDTGATGIIYEATDQEAVSVVAASGTAGPGTLTLAAPLRAAHTTGTLLTTLPGSVMWATISYAVSLALTRGATATTVQQSPGVGATASDGRDALVQHAQDMLSAYRRVV